RGGQGGVVGGAEVVDGGGRRARRGRGERLAARELRRAVRVRAPHPHAPLVRGVRLQRGGDLRAAGVRGVDGRGGAALAGQAEVEVVCVAVRDAAPLQDRIERDVRGAGGGGGEGGGGLRAADGEENGGGIDGWAGGELGAHLPTVRGGVERRAAGRGAACRSDCGCGADRRTGLDFVARHTRRRRRRRREGDRARREVDVDRRLRCGGLGGTLPEGRRNRSGRADEQHRKTSFHSIAPSLL